MECSSQASRTYVSPEAPRRCKYQVLTLNFLIMQLERCLISSTLFYEVVAQLQAIDTIIWQQVE